MHFFTSLVCKAFLMALALQYLAVLNVEANDQKDLLERLKVPPRFGKRGNDAYNKEVFQFPTSGQKNIDTVNFPSAVEFRIVANGVGNYVCQLMQQGLFSPEQCGLAKK